MLDTGVVGGMELRLRNKSAMLKRGGLSNDEEGLRTSWAIRQYRVGF